ncbi:hypothetical protein [Nocardia sp. NPDC052566]|uniref:hypothetical protein n=1 Tax=Nocardia sp. NPDC052566 TaxID=3364330 RepID=UPI0037C9B094
MVEMSTPTPNQARVLKAVHHAAARTARLLDARKIHWEHLGLIPPASWYESFHGHRRLRAELERVAAAGGVPQEWIDHIRERGSQGRYWSRNFNLPPAGLVDREQLLSDVNLDIRQLRDMAAVNAIYAHRAKQFEPATAAMFDRNIQSIWHRTVAITQLLEVTAAEAAQLWSIDMPWAADIVARLAGTELDVVRTRWREYAHFDTESYALQAATLETAGISARTAHIVAPTPRHMVEQIRAAAITTVEVLNQARGAEITAAVDAVLPEGPSGGYYAETAAGRGDQQTAQPHHDIASSL